MESNLTHPTITVTSANANPLKVLLVIDQCNPKMASVPLEGYHYFESIRQLADVTLVTHERNREALEPLRGKTEIVYIPESAFIKWYFRVMVSLLMGKKGANWPLLNVFGYLVYAETNQRVYQQFKDRVLQGEFDLVHALTPMMPRYPVKLIRACRQTPFILGPVNGGVPFPKGFGQVARKEHAHFNFFRALGRLIPGYTETYRNADRVLAGSTYTREMLQRTLNLSDDRLKLFYENGVAESFFDSQPPASHADPVNLLFVGRLVPYKGADMVLEAIARLDAATQQRVKFTIVGDGVEKEPLQQQADSLGIRDRVHFAGWIPQTETAKFYSAADVFCFPSIREFGGAVVLEAMANYLPCIVVDNGGIGEYVIEGTGFKIEPRSRDHIVTQLAEGIQRLVQDEALRQQMSLNARARAEAFRWQNKAQQIVALYHELCEQSADLQQR